ncbi:MAG: flagellar basal-body rod protein FlgF [Lachnospiraceae bacterium]|nr:flagellar basal-body rod protein FlgF [Lachnospiraceae bacterium]
MLKGLYTAWTGMVNEQNRMDVLTNNLANTATTGFKKEGTTSQSFSDVLTDRIKDTSTAGTGRRRIGTNAPGVKVGENYVDYSQGAFRSTGNTFDLALSGDGFFAIEFTNKAGETSTKYTRNGQFTLNAEGYLLTTEGDYVLDNQSRRIRLDPLQDATIDRNGRIFQGENPVATVGVVDFSDYDYLERYGETYFRPIEGASFTTANAEVYSGYLEQSNVQTVQEMVNLISISRAYETNQKILQTFDKTLDVAVNQIGRLS